MDVRAFPVEVKSGVSLWQPKDVAALFRLSAVWSAKNDRPVVLFVDQADNFFDGVQASVKTQFEIELDGFLGRGAGVFLLLTSQSVPQVVLMFSDDDDDAPISATGRSFVGAASFLRIIGSAREAEFFRVSAC